MRGAPSASADFGLVCVVSCGGSLLGMLRRSTQSAPNNHTIWHLGADSMLAL